MVAGNPDAVMIASVLDKAGIAVSVHPTSVVFEEGLHRAVVVVVDEEDKLAEATR